jgi:hypothetical protein
MFYESIGAQLGRAAVALASDEPDRSLDEREQRERRQITTLCRRIGVIWPELFSALAEESAILDATRRGALESARAHGVVSRGDVRSATLSDPLARYRQLLCEVDELVVLLHAQNDQPWAEEALRILRRGLKDAADVQGRLVDAMLAS